jgi:hypothetical protein
VETDDCANLPCAPPITGPTTNDDSKHPDNKKSDINKPINFLIDERITLKLHF